MADRGATGGDEAARLEAALERISRAGAQRPAAPPESPISRRLDALIAEIRAALGKDSADEGVVHPTTRPR